MSVALLCSLLLYGQANLGFRTVALSLTPSLGLLTFYGFWYWLGWWLWGYKDKSALVFRHNRLKLLASVLLYGVFLYSYFHFVDNNNAYNRMIEVFLYQLSMSLSVLALFGIAWHRAGTINRGLSYISAASYWIYLTQVPVIFTLISLGFHNHDNFFIASAKIGAMSFAIILLSYQFLVRHTWLNGFLGGK